ncbi:cartilage-associated protein-like [Anopheles bellator]|uniref:cartilage-associated protein-like n=1 Tax=Anopheles bellator TaxID=139047 RepID=UPI002648BE49|nr:cartilage-associated protein-like [Anopheles bellator]
MVFWGSFVVLLVLLCCCVATVTTSGSDSDAALESDRSETAGSGPDTGEKPEDGSSFIDQYEYGVQAYLTNEWEDCVYWLERALDGYRTYYESVANCRIECEYAARDVKHRGDFLHGSNVENLQHYELILRRTLCLSKCARRYAIHRYLPFSEDFDGHYMDIFHELKAYPYLHSCYLRTNRITLAASAAYTTLTRHPDHSVMRKSFEEAIEKPGIDREGVRDMEERKFVPLLIGGIVDEQERHWEPAIERLEQSIMQFIFDENQCRAFCEGEFDHGFLPDFITAIGNHFANMLYCKRNCTTNMGMVRGKYYENLFARHYRYLQNAYYQVGKYEESYRAGMSYLLFHVDDLDMPEALKTIEVEAKGSVTAKFFKARREAIEYHDRMVYEEKLASFMKHEFDRLDDQGSDQAEDEDDSDHGTYSTEANDNPVSDGNGDEEDNKEQDVPFNQKTQSPPDVSSVLYSAEPGGYTDHHEL